MTSAKPFMISIGILVVTTVAALQAFAPSVLPRLYNRWYEITGMQTRVSLEDYQRWSVRLVGLAVLVLELVVAVDRIFIRPR
jgi:hypothetical protein